MADDNANKVSEFCKVTGVDPLEGRHYLESAGWDYNVRT